MAKYVVRFNKDREILSYNKDGGLGWSNQQSAVTWLVML